jgi:hypothetical protein
MDSKPLPVLEPGDKWKTRSVNVAAEALAAARKRAEAVLSATSKRMDIDWGALKGGKPNRMTR